MITGLPVGHEVADRQDGGVVHAHAAVADGLADEPRLVGAVDGDEPALGHPLSLGCEALMPSGSTPYAPLW